MADTPLEALASRLHNVARGILPLVDSKYNFYFTGRFSRDEMTFWFIPNSISFTVPAARSHSQPLLPLPSPTSPPPCLLSISQPYQQALDSLSQHNPYRPLYR